VNLRIERWNGQHGVAGLLAEWHVREWGHLFTGWDVDAAHSEFMEQSEIDGLPATWLAFDGETLIGSISALLQDAPELNDIPGPWLASFYLIPETRGQGAAQALMKAAASAAADYGYGAWYLFTPHHERYYAGQGWQTIESRQLHGEPVAVMRQVLPAPVQCAQAHTALK
jgi:GNAT superfamily N-acetyltransferase